MKKHLNEMLFCILMLFSPEKSSVTVDSPENAPAGRLPFHTVLPDVENADQVSLDLQLQAAAVLWNLAQLADEKAAEGFVFSASENS